MWIIKYLLAGNVCNVYSVVKAIDNIINGNQLFFNI